MGSYARLPTGQSGTNCAFGMLAQQIAGHEVHLDLYVQVNESFIWALKVMRAAQYLPNSSLSRPQIARVANPKLVRVVTLGPTSSVRLHGKGRKQRSLPIWKTVARAVRDWLHVNPQLQAESPLLPRRDGKPMTRANVAQRLKLAVKAATTKYPDLAKMAVTPHLVRHYPPFLTMSRDSERVVRHRGTSVFVPRHTRPLTRHSRAATVR